VSLLALPTGRLVSARLTGSPLRWGRDMAVVGGATGLIGSLAITGLAFPPFAVAAAIVGAGAGLLLGIEMPEFLESARCRLSLITIGFRCVLAGAATGGFVALVAAHAAGEIFLMPSVVAMVAGGMQLGWLWLPYTILTVLQRPTWPLVLAAVVAAPVVGWLATLLCAGAVAVVF